MSKLDKLRTNLRRTKDLPRWTPFAAAIILFGIVYFLAWFIVRVIPIMVIMSRDFSFDKNWVLEQKSDFSCAACSIYMLLDDEGIDADITAIAWIAHTGFGGTKTEGIMAAGRAYGFNPEHIVDADFDDLMNADVPEIVLYYDHGYPHAVYAKPDQTMGYLVVMNPGRGLIYSRRENFTDHFGAGTVEAVLFIKE
jgi:ABC-type bacteriocin/lantibiotic exporter with double-glycine peptidase domain